MGKATGFLDYERQDKKAEAAKERISHFREFHKPLTEEEQKKQEPDVWIVACRSARQV